MSMLVVLLGAVLVYYGLADERELIVVTGALLVACGAVLHRFRGSAPPATVGGAIRAQVRRDVEERGR